MNSKKFHILGPVAVFEFSGEVKEIAKTLNYVAAAWNTFRGSTMVAVKLSPQYKSAESAIPIVEKAFGKKPIATRFSPSGCDINDESIFRN